MLSKLPGIASRADRFSGLISVFVWLITTSFGVVLISVSRFTISKHVENICN